MALGLGRAKNFPIDEGSDELLGSFLTRGPVAPTREQTSLNLGSREIVLKDQETTNNFSGFTEEGVGQRYAVRNRAR